MTFYNLRSNSPTERKPDLPFTIIKFDADLNPESTYSLGHTVCECPAGHRPTCRHRQMLPKLISRVDTAWFYCFETGEWEDPTGNAEEHDAVAKEDEVTGGLQGLAPEIVEGTKEAADRDEHPAEQAPPPDVVMAPQAKPSNTWKWR